jgi:hypothetical protein
MANGKKTRVQAAYKTGNRYMKNKLAKLVRHEKKHPNDAQSKRAATKVVEYRRKNSVDMMFLCRRGLRDIRNKIGYSQIKNVWRRKMG